MPVHDEVLRAARRLCRERGGWTFAPNEIVRALPHLDAGSIRTHVTSRCCVNAPRNHPHRWDYFRRVRRAVYQIRPAHRADPAHTHPASGASRVAEVGAASRVTPAAREAVHAAVSRDRDWYIAECAELAVVTQGHTLDELVANLREAVALHLDGDDGPRLGFRRAPRLVLTYETPLRHVAAP
jgi:predicted RNase H-like HicB family nuclease